MHIRISRITHRPDQIRRGPASAYENVVSMREFKEMAKDMATGYEVATTNIATGEAAGAISQAQAYQYNKIATAQGEAARMTTMMQAAGDIDRKIEQDLMERSPRRRPYTTA